MSSISPDLAAAFAASYRLERELGSGGMATVYLAEDLKHQRKVAVKVLRPELAATLGPERFNQEIRIAAQLSHPHILPVLDSGQAGGFIYYVMPLVEGESLRDRITRSGELPIADAVRILVEVTDALAYAHGRGVVHRDIKPDNIMITGRHALVMDFGVAKAVSEAGGGTAGSLTTVGMALGTPAYMSPEQAAADPNIDLRADIYALGAMGYEMLTGQPPFTGRTPQAILAAQVTQKPEPIENRRAGIPGPLGIAMMRCLEKRAADRYQTADALLAVLEPIGTPSGGTTPAQTSPYLAATVSQWYGHPLRVGGIFALAGVALLGVVYFLTIQLGLPDWVLRAALALLIVGFPIMVATGLMERRRAVAHATGVFRPSGETGVHRMMTWKRAITGGGLAFGGLTLVAAVYTAMRLLGIGPVGTLMASGHLKASDKLIVADFTNRSGDSTLGPSVTEAFRIDLAQSPLVSLMSAAALGSALERMKQPRTQPLTAEVAHDLAQREGAKAVVVGDIGRVGKGYVLTAKLVAAQDGAELVALRETADDDGQILKAIDRLSRSMRERIGESLKTIRANEPLEQVTTSSLAALRSYTEGVHAVDIGQPDRAIELLRQAVAVDTGFAMAWRKLAVALSNTFGSRADVLDAAARAFKHRDRLPELEGRQAAAYYYYTRGDLDQETSAYRSVLELDPDNNTALNNLSIGLFSLRQYAESEEAIRHAMRTGSSASFFDNLANVLAAEGRIPDAQATVDSLARVTPASSQLAFDRGQLSLLRGQLDSAEHFFQSGAATFHDPSDQSNFAISLAMLAERRGRMSEAERHFQEFMAASQRRQLPGSYLFGATQAAQMRVLMANDKAAATRILAAALQAQPLNAIPAIDRPYADLAMTYAVLGEPAKARTLLAEYRSAVPAELRLRDPGLAMAEGYMALAEGNGAVAATRFRSWYDQSGCTNCALFELGNALEQANQPDSALKVYEVAVNAPGSMDRMYTDYHSVARDYRRLGELYEAKGQRDKALDAYAHFTDLWNGADPVLQPQVREVKARMAKLAGENR